jgi:serine protease
VTAGIAALLLLAVAALGAFALSRHPSTTTPPATAADPYVPRQVVVSYTGSAAATVARIRTGTGLVVTRSPANAGAPHALIVLLPKHTATTPPQAAAQIRALPGIRYAVPDYIAHIAGGEQAQAAMPASWIPDDRGNTTASRGWQKLQWNFGTVYGIDAPGAWANLRAAGRPGASGVTIAIVDTGIAFENWGKFKRSPDFAGTHFVDPCDLIAGTLTDGKCTNTHPLDREGHGTFVAGSIAEQTNNHLGLTGLAYGATIIPIRVLGDTGQGGASKIATGIRYAVAEHAQVINLSMEFSLSVTPSQIPQILSAIRYAHDHGAVVVAAAGNDESHQIAYPARATDVVSVGATTKDRCLASYSDESPSLDIVAPGGGDDSGTAPGNCKPNRLLPDVYQMTFNNSAEPGRFSLPGGWYGTSMAAPDVSAAAAMVIASGVLGSNPTPDAILSRLEKTATKLSSAPVPNRFYGFGLLNVAAATSQSNSTPPSSTTSTPPTTMPSGGTPPSSTPTATTPVGSPAKGSKASAG